MTEMARDWRCCSGLGSRDTGSPSHFRKCIEKVGDRQALGVF